GDQAPPGSGLEEEAAGPSAIRVPPWVQKTANAGNSFCRGRNDSGDQVYAKGNITFVCHRKAWHNLTSSNTLGRRSSRAMAALASSISSSLAASSAGIKLAQTCDAQ